MKALVLLALFCFLSIASAAPVTLAWDPNPNEAAQSVLEYVLYELDLINPTLPPTVMARVPSVILGGESKVTIQVQPGVHAFVVTCRNEWNESGPSNTVTMVPANLVPDAPGGLRIVLLMVLPDGTAKIKVSGAPWTVTHIDASPDLHAWHRIFSKVNVTGDFVFFDRAAIGASQRFYRALAEPIPG